MSTADPHARWTDLAAADVLAPDDVVAVNGPNGEIALYSINGQVYATDNQCSHGQARLCEGFLLDHEIECPLHQGRFDVRTGRALCEPLTRDLPVHSVKLVDGRVWVKLAAV